MIIVAVALLSGCASYPRYFVAKGLDVGTMVDWREKGRVDVELAEDGREWNVGWAPPSLGNCVLHRENKETLAHVFTIRKTKVKALQPLQQSKEDIDCAVWDATKGRGRMPPFL